jgi:hypothetical protein
MLPKSGDTLRAWKVCPLDWHVEISLSHALKDSLPIFEQAPTPWVWVTKAILRLQVASRDRVPLHFQHRLPQVRTKIINTQFREIAEMASKARDPCRDRSRRSGGYPRTTKRLQDFGGPHFRG